MIDLKEFAEKWSFLKDKTVFIACSGGVDSIVLAALVKTFCKNITLLHVNYNLREQESIEDALFVEEFAKQNQFFLEIKSVDTNKILQENAGNLQDVARKIRFDWFAEKLKLENSVLLLAHHQDDQIETFFQHLARKSGILGLACMLEIHENIMRPLLNFSKEEIYAYAKENAISWREDSSNKSNKYTRNKLRNEFLPFLKTKIPDLNKSVLTLIKVFQENQREIENSVKDLIFTIKENHFLSKEDFINLNVEQKIFILKEFDFLPSQAVELDKLESVQKGKFISSPIFKIIKEENGFSFLNLNLKKAIPKLILEEVLELPKIFSKSEIYLDKNKIQGELKLDFWKIGDRISPVGMKGSKLISDAITEAKISNAERENILVLKDDFQIHWCVGLKVGRNAVANDVTENVLWVRVGE